MGGIIDAFIEWINEWMSAFIFLFIKLSPVDCWLLELYCANKSDLTLHSIFLPKRLHGEASGCLSWPSVSGLTTPSCPQIIKTSQLLLTFRGYSFFREPSWSLWPILKLEFMCLSHSLNQAPPVWTQKVIFLMQPRSRCKGTISFWDESHRAWPFTSAYVELWCSLRSLLPALMQITLYLGKINKA